MNGRMYDAKLGRFLSPDNYVQDPFNTQSFNRYGYVLTNPLLYNDISGELFGIDDLIAAAIGGVINLVSNAIQGNINSIGDAFIAFGAGAAAGALSLYGPAGWAAGGAITGAANAYLGGAQGWDILKGAGIGAVSGLAGGAAGKWASEHLGSLLINSWNVTSPVLQGAIGGTIGGAAGGYVGGFAAGYLSTGDLSLAHEAGLSGLVNGAGIGTATGAVSGYAHAKSQGIDPWNGTKAGYPSNDGFQGNPKKASLQPGERVDRYGSDNGKYLSPEGTPFEQRSLHRSKINDTYNNYEVLKPIKVKSGIVKPYYYQKGGGIQYKLEHSVKWYIRNGYLK